MKKIIIYILFSSLCIAKSFTLSVGVENSGNFDNGYEVDSNPRVDLEYLNHEKTFAFGIGGGINYVNVDKENYLLLTSISLNSAVNIVNNEVYKVYAGLNLIYPYPFVTVYHVDNNIVSIHPSFSHELKVGVYYNDFNASLGLSTIYLKKAYSNTETTDKINRLSVNVGYLLF